MEIIGGKIGIPAHRVKFYKDINYKRPFKYSGSSSLKKAGIENGTQVFIPAKNAKMQDIIHKPHKADVEMEEEKIETSKHGGYHDHDTPEEKEKLAQEGLTPQCNHGKMTK